MLWFVILKMGSMVFSHGSAKTIIKAVPVSRWKGCSGTES